MPQNSKPKASEPIKLETVYPIHIREKDGALAFAPPGEPIQFETDETIKTAMLAHKMNEMIIQIHRMQRIEFANNKMLAELLEKQNGSKKEPAKK